MYKELGGFTEDAVVPLGLYGLQLALNWAWTPIFFGAHKIKLVRGHAFLSSRQAFIYLLFHYNITILLHTHFTVPCDWGTCSRTHLQKYTMILKKWHCLILIAHWKTCCYVWLMSRFLSLQALIELVVLTGTVAATMVSWYPVNRTATLLMTPYMAWLCLATSLNYCIWRDNPETKKD